MSGSGAPTLVSEALTGDVTVTIVASSWHDTVMDGLIAGARRALGEAGVSVELVRVPGSFELPLGCARAFDRGTDAVVALGVVIRGGTPHFDYVCEGATAGIMELMVRERKPIGYGLLTCDNEAQALDRCGVNGSHEDKGYEAACAALAMVGASA